MSDLEPLVVKRLAKRRSEQPGSWRRQGAHISCALIGAVGTLLLSSPARAADKNETPTLSVAIRETGDVWAVLSGFDPGLAVLNKLQVSATLTGDKLGLKGWSAHAQIFRFDGQQLSP